LLLGTGHIGIILIILSVTLFSTMTVFAQNQLIFIETSQNTYEEGDAIVVSGTVTSIIVGEQVSITIFYEGNLVDIAQVGVAQDGTFVHTFLTKGPLWEEDGTFIVRGMYGKTTIETSFEFFSNPVAHETTDIFEVDAGSYGTFDVDYTISRAIVKNMVIDSEDFALVIILETDDDGLIILDLPRSGIDAKKIDGQDDIFIILIDGREVPYREISTNSNSRTITIEFEEGDSDVQIIGTFVAGSTTPPPPPAPESESMPKIPEWVRNIFIWYAEDRISEDELLDAIQFLLDQGILKSKS